MKLVEKIVEDGEDIIYDIFLSGFHDTQPSTLDRLEEFSKLCEKAGAKKGEELSKKLKIELIKRVNSFEGNTKELSEIFSQFEFYIRITKNTYF